jgi:hypothetical protein
LLPALMRSKSLMKERRIYWSASKSIVTDLTHKEILRPDAPVATVG